MTSSIYVFVQNELTSNNYSSVELYFPFEISPSGRCLLKISTNETFPDKKDYLVHIIPNVNK